MTLDRFVALAAVCVALLVAVVETRADEPAAKAEKDYGLAVGKELPFHVADFVNSTHHCGCPAVMVSNSKQRGIIVWSRGADEPALKLARALDGLQVEAEPTRLFFVAYDAEKTALEAKTKELKRVLAGRAQHSAKQEFGREAATADAAVLVFFLNGHKIEAMWSFGPEKLSNEKIKELSVAAKTFVGEK